MSKFFKALEQAERDRRLGSPNPNSEMAPDDPTPCEAETAAAAPTLRATAERERAPEAAGIPAGDRQELARPGAPRAAWPRPASSPPREELDRGAGVDDRLVSLLHPAAFEAEQYRALRHAIEKTHRATGLSVVAVSSPTLGDGKTTTAINLAGALAHSPEVRVLLIDADLRHPSLATRLGLPGVAAPTLADLVLDPALSLDEAVQACPPFNLSVIPAGSPSPGSYELFKAPRLGELLTEARRRFDYVILDTPPLVHVLDARVMGRWVDGYLIVVACHRTSRKLLAEALGVMEPEKVVGLVFNDDDRPVSKGHYHYGYAAARRRPPAGPLTRMLRRHEPGTR